jgi:hypothetical protein
MLSQFVDEIFGSADHFALGSVHGLPEGLYFDRKILYTKLESWYSGAALEETQTQGGIDVEAFPVRINPIRGAVYKHAYALFGETRQDSGALAPAKLRPFDRTQKQEAKTGEDFLARVYAENNGRSMMIRNAMISQILGGCIFKASYVKEQSWRQIPIRIEAVHPSNFIGVPMSGDEYRLDQAWIIRAISKAEVSRLYGDVRGIIPGAPEENLYYVEYWTPDEYEISINGYPIPTGKTDEYGKRTHYKGKNPFGFVPMVYIPHVRTSGFYGESLITSNIQGIVKELNRRAADWGDAVSDDSHTYYKQTGSSQRADVYTLAPGLRVVNLPHTPQITGRETLPDMDVLNKPKASAVMGSLVETLYEQFRREAFIPAVADGEDRGSQRSGQTVIMRMWPLISHTSTERIFFGDGLNLLDSMILAIAERKTEEGDRKLMQLSLPKEMTQMMVERKWAPILPPDRTAFINELVTRAAQNLGSLEHLMSLIDDIEDPSDEIKAIQKQMKDFAKVQATLMQQNMSQPDAKSEPTSKTPPDRSSKDE